MPTEVVWTKLPIVGCPGMECAVKTTTDGRTRDEDGEPLPIDERPVVCGAEGRWMLGSIFICQHHAAEVAEVMGDNIEAIEAAWKEQLHV